MMTMTEMTILIKRSNFGSYLNVDKRIQKRGPQHRTRPPTTHNNAPTPRGLSAPGRQAAVLEAGGLRTVVQ
jgi:hypothetical protein